MASKKIVKGDKEFDMFMEFWKLYQNYHDVEQNEIEYWKPFMSEVALFGKKFQDIPIAKKLAYGLIEVQEDALRDMEGK